MLARSKPLAWQHSSSTWRATAWRCWVLAVRRCVNHSQICSRKRDNSCVNPIAPCLFAESRLRQHTCETSLEVLRVPARRNARPTVPAPMLARPFEPPSLKERAGHAHTTPAGPSEHAQICDHTVQPRQSTPLSQRCILPRTREKSKPRSSTCSTPTSMSGGRRFRNFPSRSNK